MAIGKIGLRINRVAGTRTLGRDTLLQRERNLGTRRNDDFLTVETAVSGRFAEIFLPSLSTGAVVFDCPHKPAENQQNHDIQTPHTSPWLLLTV